MPHMQYIRPGDSEEVAGAWRAAIEYTDGPSMISVSRHAIPQLVGLTKRDEVKKGAYVLKEVKASEKADVTLIGVGAELSFTLNVADTLSSSHNIKARVVSFPSHALFRQQSIEYQRSVLRRNEDIPAVVIEPYSCLGWERYADAGINMSTFGHSLPGKYIYDHFGFETEKMGKRVREFIGKWREGGVGRGEFVEL